MKILISGGCKNGKTALALKIAEKLGGRRYYVASMIPCDDEDRERIKKHVAEREGRGFATIELGRSVEACLQKGNGVFVIDSVTALLTNEMFPHGGEFDLKCQGRCESGLLAVARGAENAVFVTDDIFFDVGSYDELTEAFRRALAGLNRALAAECDVVIELCAGNLIFHKGGFDI